MHSLVLEIKKMKDERYIKWFENDDLKVYVRKTTRPGLGKTLEIGNVQVAEEKQGQGIFKDFLASFEVLADELNRVVYIENVLLQKNKNPKWFQEFFIKRGYSEVVTDGDDISKIFYLKPKTTTAATGTGIQLTKEQDEAVKAYMNRLMEPIKQHFANGGDYASMRSQFG
jgi:hypothetical protein